VTRRRKFREGTLEWSDDGGFSTNVPWNADVEQARQRVAALAARGYKVGGMLNDMVTCVRCGSMVDRDQEMLDVHDRWHEAVEP
jgi:hypothetical protein